MRFNWQHKQDKKKRERARRRRQPCVYCLKPMVQGVSIDHVIPKWVLRAVPDASFHFGRQNRVMACFGCKGAKGGGAVLE